MSIYSNNNIDLRASNDVNLVIVDAIGIVVVVVVANKFMPMLISIVVVVIIVIVMIIVVWYSINS